MDGRSINTRQSDGWVPTGQEAAPLKRPFMRIRMAIKLVRAYVWHLALRTVNREPETGDRAAGGF